MSTSSTGSRSFHQGQGFQVAPADLGLLLLQHPLLADAAAVIWKPDERSGEVPVAFVVKKAIVAAAAAASSGTKSSVLPEVTEGDVKKFISSEYKKLGQVTCLWIPFRNLQRARFSGEV